MPLLQKLNMVTHKYARGRSIVTNQNKSVARERLKQKIWYLKTCWCQRLPFPVHFLSKIWRWYNVSRKNVYSCTRLCKCPTKRSNELSNTHDKNHRFDLDLSHVTYHSQKLLSTQDLLSRSTSRQTDRRVQNNVSFVLSKNRLGFYFGIYH